MVSEKPGIAERRRMSGLRDATLSVGVVAVIVTAPVQTFKRRHAKFAASGQAPG
jgi:hypothetical protein